MRSRPPSLIPAQRRQRIRELIRSGQIVRVDVLSEWFGVSDVTIRRDLDRLERDGLLARTHGGAMPYQAFGPEPFYGDKQLRCVAEKRRIGEAAAILVADGQTVLLNGGTTALEVALAVAKRADLRDVRLVTASVAVAFEVEADNVDVILVGGRYRRRAQSLVGPFTTAALQHVAADLVFLGADGVHPRFGVTYPNPMEAEVAAAMVSRCHGDVVVVADHRKLGAVAGAVGVPLASVSRLITDDGAPADVLQEFGRHGMVVVAAGASSTAANPTSSERVYA